MIPNRYNDTPDMTSPRFDTKPIYGHFPEYGTVQPTGILNTQNPDLNGSHLRNFGNIPKNRNFKWGISGYWTGFPIPPGNNLGINPQKPRDNLAHVLSKPRIFGNILPTHREIYYGAPLFPRILVEHGLTPHPEELLEKYPYKPPEIFLYGVQTPSQKFCVRAPLTPPAQIW